MQDLNELKLAFIKSYYNILSCSINHLSLNSFLVRREREREGGEIERERGGNGEKRERFRKIQMSSYFKIMAYLTVISSTSNSSAPLQNKVK